MKQLNYISEYVHSALCEDVLSPPDSTRSDQHLEILDSLYYAHQSGGKNAAHQAWATIKHLRPEMQDIEQARTLYLHVSQLSQLPRLQYFLDDYPIYDKGITWSEIEVQAKA